jgi:hypothetical protein
MNHREQKEAAREEALEHFRSNVSEPRRGMNHDMHKMAEQHYANGADQHGNPVRRG